MRETFKTKDVFESSCIDDSDLFEVVSQTQDNFDSEKKFIDETFILKRLSDGKYFELTYTKYGHGESDFWQQTCTELYMRLETKTVEIFY